METARATHTLGMIREDGSLTSLMAAETVNTRKPTLRERVEDFAKRCPFGFLDEELLMLDPNRPESSLRKRRTELVAENIILASEETRKNRSGMPCTVFYHRSHILNPPPIKAAHRKPSKLSQLQEENAQLRHSLDEFFDEGVVHERDRCVSYIRRFAESAESGGVHYDLGGIANDIELGRHL